MPKVKTYSTSVEVLQEPNPWLVAYRRFAGEDGLQDGDMTVRSFAALIGKSRSQAKSILSRMVREGLAEVLPGKRVLAQDGLKPASVSVYRLTKVD